MYKHEIYYPVQHLVLGYKKRYLLEKSWWRLTIQADYLYIGVLNTSQQQALNCSEFLIQTQPSFACYFHVLFFLNHTQAGHSSKTQSINPKICLNLYTGQYLKKKKSSWFTGKLTLNNYESMDSLTWYCNSICFELWHHRCLSKQTIADSHPSTHYNKMTKFKSFCIKNGIGECYFINSL